MNSTKVLVAILPLFLAGCLGSSKRQDVPAPQQQPRNVQQNRAVQNLRNLETRHIRDPKAMPQAHPQTPCPASQEEQRRRERERAAAEARQLEQARRESLHTYKEEQKRREQERVRAIEESRQLEQVRRESLRTSQEEQRRRHQERAAEEARQLEQARQSSLRAYEEEQKRREQERVRAIEEGRQLDQARRESLRTYQEDQKRREQRQADEDAAGWEPSSWQLVEAGKFMRELYQSKGEQYPSQDEMSAYLQRKMGLTAPQARIILEELGV